MVRPADPLDVVQAAQQAGQGILAESPRFDGAHHRGQARLGDGTDPLPADPGQAGELARAETIGDGVHPDHSLGRRRGQPEWQPGGIASPDQPAPDMVFTGIAFLLGPAPPRGTRARYGTRRPGSLKVHGPPGPCVNGFRLIKFTAWSPGEDFRHRVEDRHRAARRAPGCRQPGTPPAFHRFQAGLPGWVLPAEATADH